MLFRVSTDMPEKLSNIATWRSSLMQRLTSLLDENASEGDSLIESNQNHIVIAQ